MGDANDNNEEQQVNEKPDIKKDTAALLEPLMQEVIKSLSAEVEVKPGASLDIINQEIKQIVEEPARIFNQDTVGVKLDPSAWPIVHGSRESADHTELKQPR